MNKRLFPTDLPRLKWTEFSAEGLEIPVSGVIYDHENPATNGMPLGGIDTGCIDLETNGLLGYISIFNSLTPRRGPLNLPFLGMKVEGHTYVLATCGMAGVEPAKKISYWGHYPIADMEFESDSPVSVGLRAWSPFIPGDVESSIIPGAIFEVHLRNQSARPLKGKLAVTFPGFERTETVGDSCRSEIRGKVSGGGVGSSGDNPDATAYFLGVLGDVSFCLGDHFGWNAKAWQNMGESAPLPPGNGLAVTNGLSVTVDFSLESNGSQVVRFVLAWRAQLWFGNGCVTPRGNTFRHMYGTRFADAREVALYLADNHQSLLHRVLAWQQVIYSEKELPGWLRDSLINILHLVTENGLWAQAKLSIGDWCREEDGLFGMIEFPHSISPQIECIPCSMYGNLPLVYFFPELALSTLRGHKAYQFEDGRPAWIFGSITDMATPIKGYQFSLNGCCLIELADKMWLRTGNDDLLRELYDMCKRATIFTMNLRPEYGDKQVISMPTGNEGTEWFEVDEPGWSGMATHIGGIRLAHLRIMERMAKRMGDAEFAKQCRRWFEAGSNALEKYLWAGEYYINFYEPETNTKSDLVFGYQLDGEWMAKFHGVRGVFTDERAKTTLRTLTRCNVALSKTGAVNYANPDGTPVVAVGGYGTYSYFVPELLMLAMTYMYHGEKEFGMELARRCWENIACNQRLTWDQPNHVRGDVDTGERQFGSDYCQNMMLWSLSAAFAGQDLGGPVKPGGLVDRIMRAAKG